MRVPCIEVLRRPTISILCALCSVMAVIAPLDRWTEKEQTQAEVETFIMDQVYLSLPEPPYTPQDKADVAQLVYQHIRQQSLRQSL